MLKPLFQGEEAKQGGDAFQADQLVKYRSLPMCTVLCNSRTPVECVRVVGRAFLQTAALLPRLHQMLIIGHAACALPAPFALWELCACDMRSHWTPPPLRHRIFRVLGHPTAKQWPALEHLFHWRDNTANIRVRKPEHAQHRLAAHVRDNSGLGGALKSNSAGGDFLVGMFLWSTTALPSETKTLVSARRPRFCSSPAVQGSCIPSCMPPAAPQCGPEAQLGGCARSAPSTVTLVASWLDKKGCCLNANFSTPQADFCERNRCRAALDLLDRLLTYDPARRLTAQQALQHPFFSEVGSLPFELFGLSFPHLFGQ